jgi:hypothetical protein
MWSVTLILALLSNRGGDDHLLLIALIELVLSVMAC